MPTINLFICRDEKSKELLDNLRLLIEPVKDSVELKVHLVRIKNPEDFESFLSWMEELFGGISTLVFRKYGIEKLPAIVIGDKKVLEGMYPSLEELEEVLVCEGVLKKPAPAEAVGGEEESEVEGAGPEPAQVQLGRRKSCDTCIFYNESRRRCALLGVKIEDVNNPPCTW